MARTRETARNLGQARPDREAEGSGLIPLYHFWQPKFWGLWLAILLLRAITLLPFRWQMAIGRVLGLAAIPLLPERRRVVRVNLGLCFPELDDAAVARLVRKHFASTGMSIVETALAWRISETRAGEIVAIRGLENLRAAKESGAAVILLSGHFPGAEIVGLVARQNIGDMGAMYRPTNNALVDQVVRRARRRAIARLIAKDDLRGMIKLLKKGVPVWYASDQAYDRKGSALVPFFGEPAMTNCALTNIARMSGAIVLPFLPRRRADLRGYEAQILPPLENFPSGDEQADALRVNRLLEEHIRAAPEQYYWLHRRFKNRPPPLPDVYRDAGN